MGVDAVFVAQFLLLGIALLLVFLAVVGWNRRKDAPAAAPFAVLVFSMAIYAFGYAGEVVQTTVDAARWWLHVEYLALPWVPGLWLYVALKHKGIKPHPLLLFLIPVLTFIGHFTNVHHLFYTAPMTIVPRGPFWVLEVQRGPLSLLDNAYLLISLVISTWLYLSDFRSASTLYRRQTTVLVIGSVLPFVSYILYLTDLSPWGLDICPVTLSVTCVMLYFGYFHAGIFDLAPLARNLIFNTIRDGVLILDTQGRLLDFNPAAAILLPALDKTSIGQNIKDVLGGVPGLPEALNRSDETREFVMGAEDTSKYYEIRAWPLFSQGSATNSRQIGRAVIVADVTAAAELREDLRNRAETDPLTGIANRRRFYQALELECLRFSRGRSPFSVLMIDLDYFKSVNDRYGHPAGDAVLRLVAERLTESLRKTDLLARFGGEEFAILLPDTAIIGASIISERIRAAICVAPLPVEGFLIPVTVSIGVTSHANEREVDPQILLKKADLALYRAKATGRNRVEVM